MSEQAQGMHSLSKKKKSNSLCGQLTPLSLNHNHCITPTAALGNKSKSFNQKSVKTVQVNKSLTKFFTGL